MAMPTTVRASKSNIPDHKPSAFLRAARPMAVTTMKAIRLRMEKRRVVSSGRCLMHRGEATLERSTRNERPLIQTLHNPPSSRHRLTAQL